MFFPCIEDLEKKMYVSWLYNSDREYVPATFNA